MPPSTHQQLRGVWSTLAFAATCATSHVALAQPVTPPPPPASAAPKPEDARGLESAPGIEPEDVGLFVPRAIFYLPSRLIGMVSMPLREGLRFVERHHVIDRVVDFLYNDERTAAVVPILSASTFFGAQFGVRAFHDDLGGHGESGSIKASIGTDETMVYALKFRADHAAGSRLFIESTTSFESRPAQPFYGLGDGEASTGGLHLDPRAVSQEAFFAVNRFRQISAIGATLGPPETEIRVAGRGRYKRHDFDQPRGLAAGERSVSTVYDVDALPAYRQGSTILESELFASIDTRNVRGATSRGFYGELFAGGALPLGDFEYFHVGFETTGYIDLFHDDRVLILRSSYEGVEGASEEIPFIELPSLGGPQRLRGYDVGRFRDEHTLLFTMEYHYPIHQYLAGAAFFEMGEVSQSFGGLFTDPHPHLGGGGELILRSKDNILFTFGVAGGGGVQVYATTDPLRAFADRDEEL